MVSGSRRNLEIPADIQARKLYFNFFIWFAGCGENADRGSTQNLDTTATIAAAAAVDREFWCIRASFELTFKCPGMLWGLHCAPCISLWGSLWRLVGSPWAVLGRTLGHLGLCHGGALELLWVCLRIILGPIGKKVSALITSRWLPSSLPAHKNRPAGICLPVSPVMPERSTNYGSGPTFHTRRGSG